MLTMALGAAAGAAPLVVLFAMDGHYMRAMMHFALCNFWMLQACSCADSIPPPLPR